MKILIINGPNLNLLGKREPEIYGSKTFEAYFLELQDRFPDVELSYFQSNHEGALIDKLHEQGFTVDGIVLNAGAFTHTSLALADAVAAISAPFFFIGKMCRFDCGAGVERVCFGGGIF